MRRRRRQQPRTCHAAQAPAPLGANLRFDSFPFQWSGQKPTGCRGTPAAWLTQELEASLWQASANSGTDWNWVL
jgi:hypothetical protein